MSRVLKVRDVQLVNWNRLYRITFRMAINCNQFFFLLEISITLIKLQLR